jgi:hypothetical protein
LDKIPNRNTQITININPPGGSMNKALQSFVGFLGFISVSNFEFRSLGFVWELVFGAWNFHDFR